MLEIVAITVNVAAGDNPNCDVTTQSGTLTVTKPTCQLVASELMVAPKYTMVKPPMTLVSTVWR